MNPTPRPAATWRFRLPFAAAVFLASSIHPPSGSRAEAPPAFAERIDVQLIDVEVLVSGGDDAPVTDLRREDFRVFEDGEEMVISHFSRHVAAPVATPTGSAEVAATPPLHLGVFLDEVHVGPVGRQRALRQLAAELVAGLRPDDRVMVATYDGTVRIVLPFTTDRQALLQTLEETGRLTSAAGLLTQQERRFAIDSAYNDATAGRQACLYMESIVTNFSELEAARVRQAQRALGAFVESLRGIGGRKAVLHVSDGIPLRAGSELADYAYHLCGGEGLNQGLPESLNVVSPGPGGGYYDPRVGAIANTRYDTSAGWADLTARANAGNVSIYSFQAGQAEGVQLAPAAEGIGAPSLATRSARTSGLQDTLFLLAEETGGRASLNGNDISADVAASLAELQGYYLLSYQSPADARPGVRQIRVEVARPDVRVRHRKAYLPRSPDQQVAEQLVARLLYGAPGEASALTLERAAPASSTTDGRTRVRLRIPLDSLVLTPQGEVEQGLFTVFVAVGEQGGLSSAVRQKTLVVRMPAADVAKSADYVWEIDLPLAKPRDTVAMAVRDELSGEVSFLVRRF